MGTIAFGLSLSSLERPLALIVKALVAVPRLLCVWQDRIAMRTHLARLDDYGLKDIGLTRADIEREVSKPFWKV